jgi:anaerobic selenocysteine-containing dehydrogenase
MADIDQHLGTTREAISFCRICGAGCGTRLTIGADDRILAIAGDQDNHLTQGYACFKGLRGHDAHNHPDRLLHAMKKQHDGSHAPIPVEQALDEIADKMRALIDQFGPDAVGAFCGNGSMPNATAYPMVRDWVAAIGSSQYYSTLTIDQSAKMVSFGRLGAWAGGQQEIDTMDVVLMFGSNPLVSHSAGGILVSNPVRELKKLVANGLRMIVIDPRDTETGHFATLKVQPYPAQDAAICAGLIRMILAEGWHDAAFCETHVGADRMAALAAAVAPFDEASVEARAGLKPGELRAIATLFARDGKRGIAYASTGPNMTPYSNLAQHMVELLNVVCGRFPRAGEKVRRSNPQGPSLPRIAMAIPASRPWEPTGPGRIRGVKQIFGEKLSSTLADEILTPGEGQLQALVVAGGNIALSLPNQPKVARALEAIPLLVSIDPWMGPTSRLADYVFAPKLQYERSDISVYIPGFDLMPGAWAQYTPAAVPPPPGSELVEDWYVFWSLARRLGKVIYYCGEGPLPMDRDPTGDDMLAHKLKSAWTPFEEMRRYPHGRDFADSNGTDLGVVQAPPPGDLPRFDVMPDDVAAELADFATRLDGKGMVRRDGHEFQFLMVTRRLRDTFNSTGTQLDAIRRRTPTNPAWFNGADLADLGIREGDPVQLRTAHAALTFIAAQDDKLRAGCVQTSHGWGSLPQDGKGPETGACVNVLIDDEVHVEAINAMPHFSGVPVDVVALPNG